MVLVKKKCAPEDKQATIGVRITTAHPTISLATLRASFSEPVLEFHIHLRCTSSPRPSRPVTILTPETIFDDSHKPEDGHMDNLARGMLGGGLRCRTQNGVKRISFGYFRVHRARQENDNARNLRDRPGASFLTVPAQDTGESIAVKHTSTSERLFAYAEGKTADDLVVGRGTRLDRVRGVLGLRGGVGAGWKMS